MYYKNLKTNYRNDYLVKQPTKAGAIANANTAGKVAILENSNNRAVTITTDKGVFLQSYDTTILKIEGGKITKFWNNYTVTTMKHINTFLVNRGFKALSKKEWLSL